MEKETEGEVLEEEKEPVQDAENTHQEETVEIEVKASEEPEEIEEPEAEESQPPEKPERPEKPAFPGYRRADADTAYQGLL